MTLLPGASLRDAQTHPHIGVMHLDLSDEETAAQTQELHNIVENDRYPFSPRIRTLRAILAKLRPEPVREPLPPPKVYARAKGRRAGRWPRLGWGQGERESWRAKECHRPRNRR
jgi:hypothetical protein